MAAESSSGQTDSVAAGDGVKELVKTTDSLSSRLTRPTLTLPPRPTSATSFMFASDVSPGPMTFVSSLFSEDPDSEYRSFSQLLAGAISSPMEPASARRPPESDFGAAGSEEGQKSSGKSDGRWDSSSPLFTLPPGISPSNLMKSPNFFPSTSAPSQAAAPFEITHQQTLAQQTWQHAHMSNAQQEYHDSNALLDVKPTTSSLPDATEAAAGRGGVDRKYQSVSISVDKPADDGYNWRKYGQKHVKGSEYPRSYYKCTHSNCQVKKKVERSLDGQVTEIIYKGQHDHEPPPGRRAKGSGGPLPVKSNGVETSLLNQHGNLIRRDHESEHASVSSDGEDGGDGDVATNSRDVNLPDPKRRNVDPRLMKSNSNTSSTTIITTTTSHKTVTEPRIIVQTTSEVDLLDDGFRWRKYGQKVVKGNPYPRSYYKCTYTGCTVRKHVERASTDRKAVITTYEGKHNHDIPPARNSSHNLTANTTQLTQDIGRLQRIGDLNGNVQLKEENHVLKLDTVTSPTEEGAFEQLRDRKTSRLVEEFLG